VSPSIGKRDEFPDDRLAVNKGEPKNDIASEKSWTQAVAPRFGRMDADRTDVESAILRSREFLFSQQNPEGYWCGTGADAMLEADYIYLYTVLESGDPVRMERACRDPTLAE
jgi:squalene-hopene/tetraprenyl-beta-curcumene cyclase